MISHLAKAVICASLALAPGAISMALSYVIGSPHLFFEQHRLWAIVWHYFPLFTGVPLILLLSFSVVRRPLSETASVLISGAWVAAVFAWWAHQPFLLHADILWMPFWRHFAGMLFAGVVFGWVFAVAVRSRLGPNNSFKPKPLRGSA